MGGLELSEIGGFVGGGGSGGFVGNTALISILPVP